MAEQTPEIMPAGGGPGGDEHDGDDVKRGLMDQVILTTAAAAGGQTICRINEGAMAAFVDAGGVPIEKYNRAVSRVPLPLKFDDVAQEINFHSLIALLSFGGVHEPELMRLTGSSVDDAVKFGLIGAHLSRERLDATWMKNAHVGSISESFKIPVRQDAASSIPGVTVDRPGALVSHAEALCSVLNETGEALLSRGYTDMAQFILHSARSDSGVEGMVRSLSGALPAFQDTETVNGREVIMLKNAQVLAGELSARMGKSVSELQFKDSDKLTAVADADVITALVALGILEPATRRATSTTNSAPSEDGALAGSAVPANGDGGAAAIPPFRPNETAALRAVAVQACHRLTERLGEEYHPHELSLFLKRLSRRKEYKDVARFVPGESRAL